MSVFLTALIISFISTLIVILLVNKESQRWNDYDLNGVQKFHTKAVPRVGGLCLFIGLFFAFVMQYIDNNDVGRFGLQLLAISFLAFLFGFVEDITKKGNVSVRLLSLLISAGLAGYILSSWLSSLEIYGVDWLLASHPVISIAVTCFAVAGLANSFNIIDGYNGIASMVGAIILIGLAYVSLKLNDVEIMVSALAMIGAIAGFFFFNYPRGFIFLGDGGAYLIGFWIAQLSVLLTVRNQEVSKWFPLLLCAYPVMESLFSIYRRIFLQKTSLSLPDSYHLHHMLYRRVVLWNILSSETKDKVTRNSLTAPYLWALTLLSVIPAILFWNNVVVLKIMSFLFCLFYLFLYRQLVRFKFPNFLKIRN
jgi:UDP-N-acetylmuramyl pentapeptide phosphotransferase/UDP-N-acetylglucosamine-1-phosphate transferase